MNVGDPATKRHEKLISEAVTPVFDGDATQLPAAVGEPVTPSAVQWRGATYPVLRLHATGKGLGPCTHGSGERYVKRHWYRFETTGGTLMHVYFERRPRRRAKAGRRWWLYAIETPA